MYTHEPVLKMEVVKYLSPASGRVYLDCTVGLGGHAKAILEASSPDGRLIGIDRDQEALQIAETNLEPFGNRVRLVHANYADLDAVIRELEFDGVDGVLFDLGASSLQFDDPQRGFSFNEDAPLDMRMNREDDFTAEDLVNTWSQPELAKILREYGEEAWASRIAQFIVKARERKRITRTQELVEIVKAAIPARARRTGPHPARRTFQALRIAVNAELENIHGALVRACEMLKPGGRICVISFHSLEDRIAKRTLRDLEHSSSGELRMNVLTRKPLTPTEEEIARNPRSRGAKLRVAEKSQF